MGTLISVCDQSDQVLNLLSPSVLSLFHCDICIYFEDFREEKLELNLQCDTKNIICITSNNLSNVINIVMTTMDFMREGSLL